MSSGLERKIKLQELNDKARKLAQRSASQSKDKYSLIDELIKLDKTCEGSQSHLDRKLN